jgi:hypothetical protein
MISQERETTMPLRMLIVMILAAAAALPALAAAEDAKTLLPDGSKWSGNQLHDKSHVGGLKDRDRPCTFLVKQREDDKFAGDYWVRFRDTRVGVRIEGTIDKDGVIAAKTTKVIAGAAGSGMMDRDWAGRATDKQLEFRWKEKNGALFSAVLTPNERARGK